MLFVAGFLKDLLTKNTENAGQYSNLRKNYFLTNPKDTFKNINIVKNNNSNNPIVNNIIVINEKCNDQFTVNNHKMISEYEDDNQEEEFTNDSESKYTGTYIDDNIWSEIKTNISSVSSNCSSTKSYLYKWQPRFLETSLSSSSLEKISSSYSLGRCRKKVRKHKICKINYDELESMSREDLDYISTTPKHSIKINKDVLEKLISKYNLMCENNFNIEDEYIDDTYNDEGCFTHLEFHIV